jgi:hypothetical protein
MPASHGRAADTAHIGGLRLKRPATCDLHGRVRRLRFKYLTGAKTFGAEVLRGVRAGFCMDWKLVGVGSRESGIGSRESGVGSRESGIGNRESGIGNRESGDDSAIPLRSSTIGKKEPAEWRALCVRGELNRLLLEPIRKNPNAPDIDREIRAGRQRSITRRNLYRMRAGFGLQWRAGDRAGGEVEG